MNQQEILRKDLKRLKWEQGTPFLLVAQETGINQHTLYNFVSGRRANLGYKKAQALYNYLQGALYE